MQAEEMTMALLEQYGPLMGGQDLWRTLGYRTWAAFARSARNGSLGVRVFTLSGRKGRFALTMEVAAWLTAVGGQPGGEPKQC